MKKVVAAIGCGLVAACLVFVAGCTHTDHTAEIEELEALYGGGGSSSDVLSNVYDYQRVTDEDGMTDYYIDEDGNYKSTRPDYDSLFDYDSGYENIAPEPAGAAATLAYYMPGDLVLDTEEWAKEAKVNYVAGTVDEDGNTVTEESYATFDPTAEDNIHTGDTIFLPSRNCLTNGTKYNGYSFQGWIIVYENGSVSNLYTPSEQVTIMANGTLYPCFEDPSPDVSDWRSSDSNNLFSNTFNHDQTSTGTITLSTGFNTNTCRYETKINSTGDYWFRILDTYSIASGAEYRAKIALTNYNSTAITVNFGMSSGGYSFEGWNWNGTAGDSSETVTIEPGATAYKDYTYTTSATNSNAIFMAQDSSGNGWLDTDGAVHLGVSIDFGTPSDFESDLENEGEPVTINLSTPTGVSVPDTYTVPTNYTVGDYISNTELPSQLTDTNTGLLENKTLIGWYVHEVNESTGSVTNTIIGSSYRLTSSDVTFIPYYHMYGSSTDVVNNHPAADSSCQISNYKNSETWNTVAAGSALSLSNSGTHDSIVSQQSNQVVLDAPVSGGYATIGTAVETNNFTLSSGDKFRFTAAKTSFDPRDDNVEIYRFQNYGTSSIYLRCWLTNSQLTEDTNSAYIYLAPGETAEYVWSCEYGSATNDNMMIAFEAKASCTLNIGVTMAYVTSSSTTGVDSSLTGIYDELTTKGYSAAAANSGTTTASESNFVACSTNSTIGAGVTAPATTTALVVSYSLGDGYVSLSKND